MGRNADVLDFVCWLRGGNARADRGSLAIGFHGLDGYSLHASVRLVLRYLDAVDPGRRR